MWSRDESEMRFVQTEPLTAVESLSTSIKNYFTKCKHMFNVCRVLSFLMVGFVRGGN